MDNPVFRRFLRLHRPERLIRTVGSLLVLGVLTATAVASALEQAQERFYLEELSWMAGFPIFFAFGVLQYLHWQRFLYSTTPIELALTPFPPAEIVAGIYWGTFLRWVLLLTPLLLLLPQFPGAFEETSPITIFFFLVSFLMVLDGVGRLILMLCFHNAGLQLFFFILGISFCGVLMLYGMTGLLQLTQEHSNWFWQLLIIGPFLSTFILVVNFLTWAPYAKTAGESYRRFVRIQMEGDPEFVDREEGEWFYRMDERE